MKQTLKPTWLLAGLVLLHAGLAVHAAWNLSPVWDEIVYPASGYDLLTTGKIRTNFDHPPLAKAIYGMTFMPFRASLDYPAEFPLKTDSFNFAFELMTRSPRLAPWLIFSPRLAAVVMSVILAVLLGWVSWRSWGLPGAFLTISLYALTPPILARASLSLLAMPLTLFMTGALAAYAFNRETGQKVYRFAWGICWALALLCKVTAMLLFPIFLLSDLILTQKDGRQRRGALMETVGVGFLALIFVIAVNQGLGASYITTQWLSRGPGFFLNQFPVYFHGHIWPRAEWYFALVAWLMKTPLPLLLLGIGGAWAWARARPKDVLLIVCSVSALTSLSVMLMVRSIIATEHYFLLYPVFCLLAAGLAALWKQVEVRLAVTAMVLFVAVGTFRVHPHHLAYFNELVGGPSQGYRWLWDSDQDWGQGLPGLRQWMQKRGVSQILLGYYGAGDPRIYGIRYQDLVSPALVSRHYRGEVFAHWPGRVILVVSNRLLQPMPVELIPLLQNRRPLDQIGYTLQAYDLTGDAEALGHVAALYERTHRKNIAKQFLRAVQGRG